MLHCAMKLLTFMLHGTVDAGPQPAYDLITTRNFTAEEQQERDPPD
jgi:hypothetical protein